MINTLTPQSMAIYKELSNSKLLTAKKIGYQLGIYPQAAYRAIKSLQDLGMVEQIGKYPRKYRIRSTKESLDIYLKNAQEQYIKLFLSGTKKINNPLSQLMQITFIQNREELLQKGIEDLLNAKKQIDHIVSGFEVPAETILARKQALARGVKLRFIVQRLDEVNKDMLANWKKLGVEVKYYPKLEARIIIIDSKIVYMTSYNPKIQEEAIGVRFEYPPIAKLINELFENRWSRAKKI